MAVDYTTKTLITKIRAIGAVPQNSSNFTDSMLTVLLNEELHATIIPLMMKYRQEFFVTSFDTTITEDVTTVDIPADAIFSKIRDVTVLDADNNELSVPLLRQEAFTAAGFNYKDSFGYLVRDNSIEAHCPNRTDSTLRVYYYQRPLQMQTNSLCGQITNISSNTLTLSTIPAQWQVGTQLSFTASTQPFKTRGTYTITAISNPQITVSDSAGLAINDYGSVEGYCPFAQIPVEVQALLVSCVVLRVHEAQGNDKALKIALVKKQELMQMLTDSMSVRNDGARNVISPRNTLSRARINRYV